MRLHSINSRLHIVTAVYSVVMLTLLVKHGKSTHQVVLDEDDTVSTLMHSVEVLSGVPIRHQKLICHGKVLNAPDTLKASKVKAGSKLLLMTSGSQTQVLPTIYHRFKLFWISKSDAHNTGVACFQGQVAAQELIKNKAAAAQQRAEDFRQKQSKLGKAGDAPAASMQVPRIDFSYRPLWQRFLHSRSYSQEMILGQ